MRDCGFVLPSLDCRVPSSADAISFSLSIPHPLSTHDCEAISNTNNLHCIWKQTHHHTIFSLIFIKLTCNDQMRELLSPVARCFQTPPLSSPAPALTNTSGVYALRGVLQTPPETLLCCLLHHITNPINQLHSFTKAILCIRCKCFWFSDFTLVLGLILLDLAKQACGWLGWLSAASCWVCAELWQCLEVTNEGGIDVFDYFSLNRPNFDKQVND